MKKLNHAFDLRQHQASDSESGVGINERASAEETIRVVKIAGFGSDRYPEMFLLLRWMIHGTTFEPASSPRRLRSKTPGALAPWLAKALREQVAALVLLAADVDTANVSLPIAQFADRSVRICREFHKLQGHEKLDHRTTESVFRFLNQDLEVFFFSLQKFHSTVARQVFQQAKEHTGKQLRELLSWFRGTFAEQVQYETGRLSGNQLLYAFLEHARSLDTAEQ